jgi:hypothetical protein
MQNFISDDILQHHIFIDLTPKKLLDLYSKYPIFKSSISNIFQLYKLADNINNIEEYIIFCNNNNLFYMKMLTFQHYLEYNSIIQNSKILKFDCSYNMLQSLPDLPNVVILDCSSNLLYSLPPLPHVVNLNCSDNYLYSLPPLPNIKFINFSHNLLNTLPTFSSNVHFISLSYNSRQ